MNAVVAKVAPTVFFAVTEDWYFWSHRQPLAAYLQQQGCQISLATRFNRHRNDCAKMGLECIALSFERSLRHPFRDIRALLDLCLAVRRSNPDIVHLVSLKPILLSVLAMALNPRTQFVAAFTGMGYLFSSGDRSARWFQRSIVMLLRRLLARSNVSILVQNDDDRQLLAAERIGRPARVTVIRGVGVDLNEFCFSKIDPGGPPVVLLPGRLIRDKGVEEFVAAARIVKASLPTARFVLVGADDPDNPAAIERRLIDSWVNEGIIEWWGQRHDMPEVYRLSTIVCLPSYREGLPKVLLEAAACGRPLIASDVAGCREVCRDGLNGRLVKAQSVDGLAAAIIEMLAAPDLQRQYGAAGRELVESEYSLELIGRQTLDYYFRVLNGQAS